MNERHEDIKNPQACQTLCLNNNNCTFWTFKVTGGYCWLKSSDSGREPLTGLTSGPKICSKLN